MLRNLLMLSSTIVFLMIIGMSTTLFLLSLNNNIVTGYITGISIMFISLFLLVMLIAVLLSTTEETTVAEQSEDVDVDDQSQLQLQVLEDDFDELTHKVDDLLHTVQAHNDAELAESQELDHNDLLYIVSDNE